MIGYDLHQRTGASTERPGNDRDVGEIGHADTRHLDARAQAPADPDAAVDEPSTPLDRMGGDLAYLGALEKRVNDAECPSIQVHRTSSSGGVGGSQRITTRAIKTSPWPLAPRSPL